MIENYGSSPYFQPESIRKRREKCLWKSLFLVKLQNAVTFWWVQILTLIFILRANDFQVDFILY